MVVLGHAATTKVISVNTSPLIGHPAGPFSVAFQLTDGGGTGDGNNTVTISAFQFGGGSASGSPVVTGGASGDLSSTVTLTDSAFLSFFVESFVPGTVLSFAVTVTGNVESGPIPDRFSFSILDSTGAEVPTLAGENFDQLVSVDFNTANPVFDVFATDTIRTSLAGGGAITLPAPVVVVDVLPPTVSMTLSPSTLWPPNHKLVAITATLQISDNLDPKPRVELVSVTSNEPDNGLGDGDTANDIEEVTPGTDDRVFLLRAERSATGPGRFYTVVYRVTDTSGNATLVQGRVAVSPN